MTETKAPYHALPRGSEEALPRGVTLSVPGEPVALARARAGKPWQDKAGRWHFFHTPEKSLEAEKQIALAWKASRHRPFLEGVPLKIKVQLYYAKPAKPARSYPSRGDLDNCVKLVLDALQRAGAFANDSQIVQIEASKQYDEEGWGPTTDITITDERASREG